MRLTKRKLKLIIEQYLINEASWSNSEDMDYQASGFADFSPSLASDVVLFFESEDIFYGADPVYTHERDSHTLKHMIEFDRTIIGEMCEKILEEIKHMNILIV